MPDYSKIKWKYMFILLFLFLIMVIGRIFYDYNHYENILQEKVLSLKKQINNSFQASKQALNSKYKTISYQFMLDDKLAKMQQNHQTKLMYNYLKNNYESLKKDEHNLYVMHFFDANNKTILRMHKPDSFGDDLTKKRPLIVYVNETQKQISEFEVGKNGTVYRITTPFVYNKKNIGILEFGIKPDYFVEYINKNFKVESKILVKTDSLKVLTKKTNFKKMGDYSIVSQNKLFEKISSKIDLNKPNQLIEQNGESYIIITDLDFKNHLGETVAKIIVAKDITEYIQQNKLTRLSANSITIIILLLALIILYIIFTKYENDLINSYIKVSQLEKKSTYLKNKSNRDSLTKVYNKNYINKYLKNYISNNSKGVIIFFDIDHFKNCNDTYGHLVGDSILKQLSHIIQNNLRDGDIFARWGGEEFIILLEDIGIDKASKIAEKIRKLVEKTEFTQNIYITISIGYTTIKDTDTLNSLMLRVDELLYQAKENGRNMCISDL